MRLTLRSDVRKSRSQMSRCCSAEREEGGQKGGGCVWVCVCVCVCVVGREGWMSRKSWVSYCSRGGWWAEPSLSGPLPGSARCWCRSLEARSWVASLLQWHGNKISDDVMIINHMMNTCDDAKMYSSELFYTKSCSFQCVNDLLWSYFFSVCEDVWPLSAPPTILQTKCLQHKLYFQLINLQRQLY